MKISFLVLPLLLCGVNSLTQAQTYYYSFPLYSIVNAMPTGMKLPDGTTVKAEKISTGTGVYTDTSGTAATGTNMGGTFTGKTIAAYTGSKIPTEFTVIQGNVQTIDNGVNANCAASIGFRIYFDRPTTNINFLGVDIDGAYNGANNPGNAEWVSSIAFNGNTFVPFNQIKSGNNLSSANITLGANHSWRTLVTNKISATAAANIPSTLPVKYAGNNGLDPDDTVSQVFFNPATAGALVTDYFFMWGLYAQTNNVGGQQRSGVSPIVVSVKSDFGDAPDSYKTLLASGGPSHGVLTGLSLGALNEQKLDGTPSAMANFDIDDDGATISPIVNSTQAVQTLPTYTITTTYINNTGRQANYVCWIDWNGNGTFEASEAQTATKPAASSNGNVSFTWNNVQLTGVGGATATYARIRLTTDTITTADIGGAFNDGEVEDYRIPLMTPLAVRLADFRGSLVNSHAQLNWHTAEEKNAKSFIVEYASNGTEFTAVGEVAVAGSGREYSYTDMNPARNINYYRLRMINEDGTETFSKIICLKSANITPLHVTLAPNPVYDIVHLNIRSEYALAIQVYDILGNVLYTMKTPVTNEAAIDCSNLLPGTYFVKAMNDAGEMQTLQFVKN